MLNGRPEATSRMGASVHPEKNLLAKPLPLSVPLWYTPLNTKRCRWSKAELERSAARIVVVLRLQRRLQIGRVVNGMRPGVGRQKFVVLAEAFTQVGGEAVVDRTPIGEIGRRIAEGYATGQRRGIAGSAKTSACMICCASPTQAAAR